MSVDIFLVYILSDISNYRITCTQVYWFITAIATLIGIAVTFSLFSATDATPTIDPEVIKLLLDSITPAMMKLLVFCIVANTALNTTANKAAATITADIRIIATSTPTMPR